MMHVVSVTSDHIVAYIDETDLMQQVAIIILFLLNEMEFKHLTKCLQMTMPPGIEPNPIMLKLVE
ncbi:hypothetical protein BLOT_013485 [Blomia tropicalis]|nr:hypothetical protein BLOT_013485 [Blomia tropicalis]